MLLLLLLLQPPPTPTPTPTLPPVEQLPGVDGVLMLPSARQRERGREGAKVNDCDPISYQLFIDCARRVTKQQ